MKIKTAAKINLTLDVTGKLPNGYHSIESVFQTVGLYDEITVEITDGGEISLTCEVPEKFSNSDPIPCDERNIAYKAARKFFDENHMNCGCRIHIKKGIPSQAGMGGGSTDAAAVLYCLGKLTGNTYSTPERLGADVPFFLTGGTAFVEGIGEKITPAPDYSGKILVIAKGDEGVSTAEAYGRIDVLENPVHPDNKAFLGALANSPEDAPKYIGNLFEEAVGLKEVRFIKDAMLADGAAGAAMTGSGSSVFGIFNSLESAKLCSEFLENKGFFSCVCETVSESFVLV